MSYALRAAASAAVLAACALGAGTAAAAPPLDYDQEIISQIDSANSVQTVRHLAVDIGPRRSGTPQERVDFKQSIASTDGLRTGSHAKTLTFTLSTTSP